MVSPRRRTGPRTLRRALLSIALALAATLGLTSAASADEGDSQMQEGYLLVQGALGYLAHEGARASDIAMEKIDASLAASDQAGVDVNLVRQAKATLQAGDVATTQELLQKSIATAVSNLPRAVGEDTGTSTVPSDLPGRGPLSTLDWTLLALSVLLVLGGAAGALRSRPHDSIRSLQARLRESTGMQDRAVGTEL
jgi:hypothetical protein